MRENSNPSKASPSWQWRYLFIYNATFALLWSAIFISVAWTGIISGFPVVHFLLNPWVLFVQTLAALEIIHSLAGIVRAPVLTTFLQIAGRNTVLWAVILLYPTVSQSPFYSFMLLAWSAADVIRYVYFACTLAGLEVPALVWLRYSAFYVLYPIGIVSELVEVYLAIVEAWNDGERFIPFAYVAAAMLYIPAAPTLYNHMRNQRRKVVTANSADKTV